MDNYSIDIKPISYLLDTNTHSTGNVCLSSNDIVINTANEIIDTANDIINEDIIVSTGNDIIQTTNEIIDTANDIMDTTNEIIQIGTKMIDTDGDIIEMKDCHYIEIEDDTDPATTHYLPNASQGIIYIPKSSKKDGVTCWQPNTLENYFKPKICKTHKSPAKSTQKSTAKSKKNTLHYYFNHK